MDPRLVTDSQGPDRDDFTLVADDWVLFVVCACPGEARAVLGVPGEGEKPLQFLRLLASAGCQADEQGGF